MSAIGWGSLILQYLSSLAKHTSNVVESYEMSNHSIPIDSEYCRAHPDESMCNYDPSKAPPDSWHMPNAEVVTIPYDGRHVDDYSGYVFQNLGDARVEVGRLPMNRKGPQGNYKYTHLYPSTFPVDFTLASGQRVQIMNEYGKWRKWDQKNYRWSNVSFTTNTPDVPVKVANDKLIASGNYNEYWNWQSEYPDYPQIMSWTDEFGNLMAMDVSSGIPEEKVWTAWINYEANYAQGWVYIVNGNGIYPKDHMPLVPRKAVEGSGNEHDNNSNPLPHDPTHNGDPIPLEPQDYDGDNPNGIPNKPNRPPNYFPPPFNDPDGDEYYDPNYIPNPQSNPPPNPTPNYDPNDSDYDPDRFDGQDSPVHKPPSYFPPPIFDPDPWGPLGPYGPFAPPEDPIVEPIPHNNPPAPIEDNTPVGESQNTTSIFDNGVPDLNLLGGMFIDGKFVRCVKRKLKCPTKVEIDL